jgi:hypothetical protein
VLPTKLEFRISRLSQLGWNGTSPIQFKESTQSGVPGTPNQGFPDETSTFTGTP